MGTAVSYAMGDAGGEGSAGEGAVLADATAVAEQLKKLADNPGIDERTIDQVMQLVEPAMSRLNSRKKEIRDEKDQTAGAGDADGESDRAPLMAPTHTDTDLEDNLESRHRDVVYLLILCLAVLAFVFLFAVLFWFLEKDQKWTLIDGWFFAVVTIGTVGYGVLTPSNDGTRGAVVVFLVLGVAVFIFAFSLMTELLLSAMEDFTVKNKLHKYTICGPRSLGLLTLLITIITTGTLYGVISEEWSFIEALYWTVVTITTVGYGDYAPSTQAGRMAVSWFILIACGAFAAILGGVVASYISIRHRAAAINFMITALTSEKLAKMPRNVYGEVTRVEFVEHMLIKLGYTSAEDLELIHACFDALDIDGNGKLDVTDLIRSDEGQVLLEKMRLEHGIADSDRNMLPFGLFGIRFKFLKDKEKFDETANQVILEEAKAKAKSKNEESDEEDLTEKATATIASLQDSLVPTFESIEERKARINAKTLSLSGFKKGGGTDADFAALDLDGDGKLDADELRASGKLKYKKKHEDIEPADPEAPADDATTKKDE